MNSHIKISRCRFCDEKKSNLIRVIGDYDGDEGADFHEPEDCPGCSALEKYTPKLYSLALKFYKECRTIRKEERDRYNKELEKS